jgi:NAD(P)-dependent dehydrogenase (short-subunit alcohol dehydrogenase family)
MGPMSATMFKSDLLKGKRILVTGGGTGLGEVMTEAYAKLGASVYICGRRAAVVEETAKRISGETGGSVKGMACDIRVAEAVDEMIAQIWADGGALTGLVNNAAGNFISRTKDLSPRGFTAISDIVFRGSFYVTLACGKRWIEARQKASVISILTTWIWNGGPFTVPSAMSKAGINIMTKSLAVEWGPNGIRLNAIAPGPFPTKGAWERLNPSSTNRGDASSDYNPMGRVGEMPELANLAVFLMADGCEYLTGQTIAIDGGAHLASGGNFSGLARLSDNDWQKVREEIRGANDKDKAQRS